MAKDPVKARAADPFSQGREIRTDAEGWNHQWKEVGQRIMGTLIEFQPFRNGHKCVIDDELSGVVKLFSCPDKLAKKLAAVKIGQRVGIEFTGEQDVGQDSPLKLFRVVVLPEKDSLPF